MDRDFRKTDSNESIGRQVKRRLKKQVQHLAERVNSGLNGISRKKLSMIFIAFGLLFSAYCLGLIIGYL
jgi:hypothetical protein